LEKFLAPRKKMKPGWSSSSVSCSGDPPAMLRRRGGCSMVGKKGEHLHGLSLREREGMERVRVRE
jgi:hypothetical protein